MNKKYLIGLVALLILAAAGNSYFLGSLNYDRAIHKNEQSIAATWVYSFLGIIADKWNPDELMKRAHPILVSNIKASGRDLNADFAPLRALGKLKKDNCVLSNYATSQSKEGETSFATFSCAPEFESGEAKLVIEIKRDHPKSIWKVTAFTFSMITIYKEEK